MIRLGKFLGDFIELVLGFFQRLLIREKFKLDHKNSLNLFMTIAINEIVFKENSGLSFFLSLLLLFFFFGLSLDVGFTQLSFNSVY